MEKMSLVGLEAAQPFRNSTLTEARAEIDQWISKHDNYTVIDSKFVSMAIDDVLNDEFQNIDQISPENIHYEDRFTPETYFSPGRAMGTGKSKTEFIL